MRRNALGISREERPSERESEKLYVCKAGMKQPSTYVGHVPVSVLWVVYLIPTLSLAASSHQSYRFPVCMPLQSTLIEFQI